MIRIDAMWLAADPVDMRAGANRLIARAVQVFGAAQAHHSCPLSHTRLAVPSEPRTRRFPAVSAVLLVFGPAACCHFDPDFLAFFRVIRRSLTRIPMRKLLIIWVLGSAVAVVPAIAGAKGCLKGAAVGGVAGHVAGHHGLIGAAAGCAIEHHREKVRDKAAAQPSVPSPAKDVTPMSSNTVTPAR